MSRVPSPQKQVVIPIGCGIATWLLSGALAFGFGLLVPSTAAEGHGAGALIARVGMMAAAAVTVGMFLRVGRIGPRVGIVIAAGAVVLMLGFVGYIGWAARSRAPLVLDARARAPLVSETEGNRRVVRHSELGFTFRLPEGFGDPSPAELAEFRARSNSELVQGYWFTRSDGAVISVVLDAPIRVEQFDEYARGVRRSFKAIGRHLRYERLGKGKSSQLRFRIDIPGDPARGRLLLIPGPSEHFYPLTVAETGVPPEDAETVLESIRLSGD